MTVDVLADHAAATARAAADVIATLRTHPRAVLGLPTGRTPIGVYQALSTAEIDWSGVRTFNLDEFAGIPPSHPSSFRAFMDAHLFQRIALGPEAIGFLRGDAPDLAAECARYDAVIDAAGGIDLLMLGLGANGHIGFNEPAETLSASTFVATLHDDTRRANAHQFGGAWQAVPARALTIGMRHILSATRVVVVATGAAKAEAVAAMSQGPLTPRCPASWLQTHRQVRLVVDREAAARIR